MLRPSTAQWVCWPGESPLFPAPPLHCSPADREPHTIPLGVGERDLSPRNGPADWKSLGEVGAWEQPPPKAPASPPVGPGLPAQNESSVCCGGHRLPPGEGWWGKTSQCQERFACPAQGQRCLLPPAREMRHMSRNVCNEITQYFLELLSGKETCWELPAMAFLVEVSLMASTASLSCLQPLCPLVGAAAGGAQCVVLRQGVVCAACPWLLAAGVMLVPSCVLCPPCASSRSSIVAPWAEESEGAEGWEAQRRGRATCAVCPAVQSQEPRGSPQSLPPSGSAAWDGARALCCWLEPALHGAGVLPAGHPPVTALCVSARGLPWYKG